MSASTRWNSHLRYPFLLAKYAGGALTLALVFLLVYRLRVVFIPVLFSALLAFVLAPAVDALTRRRVPRVAASAVAVTVGLIAVAALGLLIVPTLIGRFSELISRIPAMLETLSGWIGPWSQDLLGAPLRLDAEAVNGYIQGHVRDLAAPSGWVLRRVFAGAVGVGLLLMNLLIVVVGTFFLVRSSDRIGRGVVDLVPPRHQALARRIGEAVDQALSGFIRGQLSVCVVMACVYALLLTLLGVPGGAVIGVLAGLLNFLPYVGISVGAILALLSVALDYSGPLQVLGVVGVFSVVPVLDGMFITPSIVGNKVGLNPYVLILALLVGGELMGFLGLLLAVPATAVLRALLRLGLEAYRQSHFYLDGAPEAAAEDAPSPGEGAGGGTSEV